MPFREGYRQKIIMYPIPGHLALGLTGARITSTPLFPVLAATFLPDIVDKVMTDVIALAPYGRCWFHTLLSVVVFSSLCYFWKGKQWGIGWAVGHLLHLFGDIGFIPWFYPFLSYEWPDAPNVTQASVEVVQNIVEGKEFSGLVKQVFIPWFLIIESIMLGIAGLMWWISNEDKPKQVFLLVLFLCVSLYRIS